MIISPGAAKATGLFWQRHNPSEEIHLRGIGMDGLKRVFLQLYRIYTAMLLSQVEFLCHLQHDYFSCFCSKQLTTQSLHSPISTLFP